MTAARVKMTFKAGELSSVLQKHDRVVTSLRADVHHNVQQQVAHDLLLELRHLSPRVTFAALQEAMVPLRVSEAQKFNAARTLTDVWQTITKKLRNSP
eukprot:573734-Amphidinium_carterae.1